CVIRANGFAILIAVIPDSANVVLGVGVHWVGFSGLLVVFEGKVQRSLLVKRDPELVEVNRVSWFLVGQALVDGGGFAIFLANHVQIGELLLAQLWLGPQHR